MKNIAEKLIPLLKKGYCTPQIGQLARKLKQPSTTLHYNLKKLEQEGAIKTYKAVFDYKKINEGFCVYVVMALSPDEYGNPERIGGDLAWHPQVESVDVCTGDWELIVKVRVKDHEEYFSLLKNVLSRKGIMKIKSFTSLKQIKTEFVEI